MNNLIPDIFQLIVKSLKKDKWKYIGGATNYAILDKDKKRIKIQINKSMVDDYIVVRES